MEVALEPIWVDSNVVLADLCDKWSGQSAIAVDTEFMRVSTFYPIAGLIQIGDGTGCYLIDPLSITDFSPLKALFSNACVTKVLHACSEDLEVFLRLLGVVPTPVFDTQIAAALCGYGFSVGYAGLIAAALGVEIEKGETRSDWLRRPLSVSQLKYAALDVGYLFVAYGRLRVELESLGRLPWVLADCEKLGAGLGSEPGSQPVSDGQLSTQQVATQELSTLSTTGGALEYAQAYIKVKSAWKLTRQELAILQRLASWRESCARERDLPRNRLLKERALWDIAKLKPKTESHLQRVEGLVPRMIHRDGEAILSIVKAGLAVESIDLPERLPMPLPPEQGDRLKALKVAVRLLAEDLKLPPEMLARKKDYEFIVRSGMNDGVFALPPSINGWRHAVVGKILLEAAADF